MMTKLKIDMKSGTLEVEGEEAFVERIYQDYKEKISKREFIAEEESSTSVKEVRHEIDKKQKAKGVSNKPAKIRKESHQIIKDLDLSPKDGKESLKAFYEKKAPISAMEKDAVFVYYLEKIAEIKNINPDHVYTCFKNVNERVPGALRQSLLDTSSRKGWIDTASMDNIKLSIHGENLVEHELPAKDKKE